MYLTKDIISSRGFVYGKAGESVDIVAEHGEVMIIQSEEGDRYACRLEFLTDKKPESDETIQPTSEPESVRPGKKTKNKKAAPPAQPGLFG